MPLLRLVVPAVTFALALPASTAALSPVPTVPLHISGDVLSCYSDGGCAYLVSARHESWMPATTDLAIGLDGDRTTLSGELQVPVGPLTVTVIASYVSDVVMNGKREIGPVFARCDLPVDVPDDGHGVELTVITNHRACVLDAAPSTRTVPSGPPEPVSPLRALHRLPDSLDPSMALPPFTTLMPSSATGVTVGVAFPWVLRHCGLYSPVDLDGAFWDPIGGVDAGLGPIDSEDELGELINATEVEALLVTPDRLDLRTPLGTVVVLARHEGGGDYPGCD